MLITTHYYIWKLDINIILEEENLLEIIVRNEFLRTDGNSRVAIKATY
jgi:hypothetical protein